MFECTNEGCTAAAEWEPTLVIVQSDEEVRVGLPVTLCTPHRRGLRSILLEGGLPPAESALTERGVDLHATSFRIEFTSLH